MTTHPSEEQLNDYVDGRLKGPARDAISQHLLDCHQCQRSVAAIEQVVEEARLARDSVTAPAELWPIVAATTVHDSIVRRHVLKRMWPQLSVAVGILMLLSAAAGVFGTRLAMRMGHALQGDRTTETRVIFPGSAAPLAPAAAAKIAIGGSGSGGSGGSAQGELVGKSIAMQIATSERMRLLGGASVVVAHRTIAELEDREAAVLDRLELEATRSGWSDFRVAARERLARSDRALGLAKDAYLGASNFGKASDEQSNLEGIYKERATLLERLLREGKEAWLSSRAGAP